jgi:hypothetical protein
MSTTPGPRPRAPRRFLLAASLLALAGTAAHAQPSPPSSADGANIPAEPQLSPLRLEVNLPAYRLDAFVHDQLVATFPVTAGARWEPTITGRFTIDQVQWNPWWHPPAHRRPKDKVTPPGPRNPMGRVKLPFHGLYYIHGTAREQDIGRAASRGCVRLRNEDAIAVAQLVHRYASPALPPAELDALIADPRRSRTLKLELPVEVVVAYRLVEVRDGGLAVYSDVYRQESRTLLELATSAIAAAGNSAARLAGDALAEALATLPPEGGWVDLAATAARAAGAVVESPLEGGAAGGMP